MNWRDRAACRGLDADLFFPDQYSDAGPGKQVCATCPVKTECLEWALENRELFGTWGGVGEGARRRMRRNRRTAA